MLDSHAALNWRVFCYWEKEEFLPHCMLCSMESERESQTTAKSIKGSFLCVFPFLLAFENVRESLTWVCACVNSVFPLSKMRVRSLL